VSKKEEKMDDDKKKNLALMKYGAIAPIINELPEEYSSYSEYFDRVSAKGIIDWNGSVRYYAANTIEGWYRKYIRYGFDSLISKGRSDLGKPRKMDEDTMEKVRYLKDHYKRMGATAIYNQLLNDGDISKSDFSQSTLSRYLKRYAAEKKAALTADLLQSSFVMSNDNTSGHFCNSRLIISVGFLDPNATSKESSSFTMGDIVPSFSLV
jgi:hypothetical protein